MDRALLEATYRSVGLKTPDWEERFILYAMRLLCVIIVGFVIRDAAFG